MAPGGSPCYVNFPITFSRNPVVFGTGQAFYVSGLAGLGPNVAAFYFNAVPQPSEGFWWLAIGV